MFLTPRASLVLEFRDLCKLIWVPDVILFVESSLKSLTVIGEDENLAFMIWCSKDSEIKTHGRSTKIQYQAALSRVQITRKLSTNIQQMFNNYFRR